MSLPSTETKSSRIHRYSLVLPMKIGLSVEMEASERGATFTGLMRQFIRLGLETEKALVRGGKLVKREGEKETEILIV